jgi:hypothetical protein
MDEDVEVEVFPLSLSIWCWQHSSYHEVDLTGPDGACTIDYFRSNGWSGLDIEYEVPVEVLSQTPRWWRN